MFNQLLAELKASIRLRLGLALIVAVLWLNGVLSLRDQLAEDIKRQGQLAGQINRARLYATQTEWPERARQAQIALAELEGRLWRSDTQGLAQAAFQDWLAQSLRVAVVGRPDVTLVQDGGGGKSDGADTLWKVKAKLAFDFAPHSFHQWMSQLAGYDRQVVIEQLDVRLEPLPRVEAILIAPFQKGR
ncbi:hypothetical protein [Methylomagnum sp.]